MKSLKRWLSELKYYANCAMVIKLSPPFMNTLIVSTFSCSFDSFKKDVTELFLEDMCKEFVTAYEFVKVDEHKSHLLMNVTDLEKLGAAMADPVATEWDKKNNCQDTVYKIELVE